MGRLILSDPPKITGVPRYTKYRNWLKDNFYHYLCGYCFAVNEFAVIDHIAPKEAFPSLAHRHDNLILSCQICNRQKGDYHPNHSTRKRFGKKIINHLVVNCKIDDFAQIFEVQLDGNIFPKPGISFEKAGWSIVLLSLDRDYLNTYRATMFRNLRNLDAALNIKDPPEQLKPMIAALIEAVAKTQLFYRVMGIPISTLVEQAIADINPKPLAKVA